MSFCFCGPTFYCSKTMQSVAWKQNVGIVFRAGTTYFFFLVRPTLVASQLKPTFFFSSSTSRDDWVPDTGNDDQIQYKLNVCHTVLYKELDVKNPDGVASWGKRGKGRSLG